LAEHAALPALALDRIRSILFGRTAYAYGDPSTLSPRGPYLDPRPRASRKPLVNAIHRHNP